MPVLSRFVCLLFVLAHAVTTSATYGAPPAADFTAEQVIDVMRRAADYQLAEQAKTKPNVEWVRAAFYTGVMATYRTTQDAKYLDAALAWAEQGNWAPAKESRDWRYADDIAAAQTYLELYEIKRDPRMLERTRDRYDRLMLEPRRGRADCWWCDSLFMSPPGLARLGKVTGDNKYLAFLDEQFWDATDFLFDPES